MPTQSFVLVNFEVLFPELASPALISDKGPVRQAILWVKRGSLRFCVRFYWTAENEMRTKIDDRGSDLGHDDVSILGRNASFGLLLGGQLPGRTSHSSLGSTNYHVRELSLDLLINVHH